MIFDAENLFSKNQAVTATAVSQNVVKVVPNAGAGEPIFVSAGVTTPFAGLTSLVIELQSAPAETGTWSVLDKTESMTPAELNSGKVVNFGSIPPRSGEFLRLNYVVVGTATAGKITAGIVWDRQTNGKM